MKIKIACIGDSITYGAGVPVTRKRDCYPSQLARLLGRAYLVHNFGMNGRTLMDEADKPYRKEKAYDKSKKYAADIYLIMLGTNDSKTFNWNRESYKRQLLQFVEEYRRLPGKPGVFLMTCCAAFQLRGKAETLYSMDKAVIANDIKEIICDTGKQCGIGVIDIYEVTKEHPEFFVDGIHPNARGNRAIARTVYKSILTHTH